MFRAFSLKSPLPWVLLFGACLAASCDDRGVTSVCPPLPLYQSYPLGDASLSDASSADGGEAQTALAAAIDAGCATAPSHFSQESSAAGASGATNESSASATIGGAASETAGAAGGD